MGLGCGWWCFWPGNIVLVFLGRWCFCFRWHWVPIDTSRYYSIPAKDCISGWCGDVVFGAGDRWRRYWFDIHLGYFESVSRVDVAIIRFSLRLDRWWVSRW